MKTMLIALLVLAPCSGAFAKDSKLQENDQLRKASMVMNEIMQTPDKGIPNDMLDKAVCVGIVPSEIKAAFGVGGTYGKGVLVCREHGNGHWGAPSLFTMGGGSRFPDWRQGHRRGVSRDEPEGRTKTAAG